MRTSKKKTPNILLSKPASRMNIVIIIVLSLAIGILATFFDHLGHLYLFGVGETLDYYSVKVVAVFIPALAVLYLLPKLRTVYKSVIIAGAGAALFAVLLIYYIAGVGYGYTNWLHLMHFFVMLPAALVVLYVANRVWKK